MTRISHVQNFIMHYYKKKFNKNFTVFTHSPMYVFGTGTIKAVDII